MKRLIFGAALLSATALTSVPLAAQDRGRNDTFVVTSNQVVDMADARIAQLKADLRLTPDQDKNWGSLQTALHDMAQRRADRMQQMREQRSAASAATTTPAPTAVTPAPASDPNARPRDDLRDNRDNRDMRDRRADRDRDAAPDVVAELRRRADEMTAKADDFRKFADASGPLYASLDESQKGRFLAFTQRNMIDDTMQASPPRRGRDRW